MANVFGVVGKRSLLLGRQCMYGHGLRPMYIHRSFPYANYQMTPTLILNHDFSGGRSSSTPKSRGWKDRLSKGYQKTKDKLRVGGKKKGRRLRGRSRSVRFDDEIAKKNWSNPDDAVIGAEELQNVQRTLINALSLTIYQIQDIQRLIAGAPASFRDLAGEFAHMIYDPHEFRSLSEGANDGRRKGKKLTKRKGGKGTTKGKGGKGDRTAKERSIRGGKKGFQRTTTKSTSARRALSRPTSTDSGFSRRVKGQSKPKSRQRY